MIFHFVGAVLGGFENYECHRRRILFCAILGKQNGLDITPITHPMKAEMISFTI